MTTWLKLLPLEVDSIKSVIDTPLEVGPKDHAVGVLSNYLQKLLTLWRLTDRATEQCQIDMKYSTDKDEREKLHAKFHELRDKAEAVSNIFWIAVRDDFDLWGKESVGIRKGFTIVWSDSEPEDNLPPFLRGFLRLE